LLDGYLFHPSWFSPMEGPLTRLGKVVRANALTTDRLLKEMLGWAKSTTACTAADGRGLLDVGWINPSNAGLISATLLEQSPAFGKQSWFRSMAGDERIRYCPICLEQGFHSSLCQIAGIVQCPSHADSPLLDSCLFCKTPTPRFAVTRQTFENPLCCPHCSRPYAPSWSSSARIGAWQQVKHLGGYTDLARWLSSLDQSRVHWADHPAWLSCSSTPEVRHHKRVMTFEALTLLANGPICKDGICVSVQLFSSTELKQDKPVDWEYEAATRLKIYKSIRRHASRRVKAWRLLPRIRDDLVQLGGCGSVLSRTTAVPSALLGLIIWRRRFERYMNPVAAGASQYDRLELHPEVAAWPAHGNTPAAAWGYFAHRCLVQDCKAAANWAAELDKLPDEGSSDWRTAWAQLLAQWQQKTVPGAQRASDSVTQARIPGQDGGGQFALIWSSLGSSQSASHENSRSD